MTPQEALTFIFNTSTLAPVPKARHGQCEQAANVLVEYLNNSELKKPEEKASNGKMKKGKGRIPESSKKE